MPALLDHADPRLGLRAARAAPNDPMTRAAIRLLGDTLAESGDGVLSGPAVGLPVQIIALRQGDLTGYYLNPTIVSLGPLALSHAETSQHTGPIRRNTPRAKKLTFRGTDLSGVAQQADLSGELALRAQQAFDLLDSPAPLGWLSAFHRALLNERDAPRRQLFEAVNVGLYSTPPYDGSRPETASGLRFSAPNIVAVHPDAPGAALTHIDGLDPLRPTGRKNRALLSLMAALSTGKPALFSDPSQLDLIVGTLLIIPGMKAFLTTQPDAWPMNAISQLGLAPSLRSTPLDVQTFDDPLESLKGLDSVLVDLTVPSTTSAPDVPALRNIARALAGTSGALLCVTQVLDPELEDRLKTCFTSVYLIEVDDNSKIYCAMKTPIDIGSARARLLSRTTKTGAVDLGALLSIPWLSLRKDGQREVL
ncbi:peptide deformylase [Sulfitobacter sp.]|uniref:peptide deformylase n=1 Tax=Sulfitobacter sp. TaxID=1903071 RepID=UPI003F6C2982